MQLLSNIWLWWGYPSPPLAYSIIRYSVFSVWITSNNWTATNKKNCYHKSHKHVHPPHPDSTDRVITWIATHLCLDDSEFSWCVPLEITEKQNLKNKLSNHISRELMISPEKRRIAWHFQKYKSQIQSCLIDLSFKFLINSYNLL